MDPYFDPSKSHTSEIKQCGGRGQKCFFRQSYSEGSSWHAFKVKDRVYIGGNETDILSRTVTMLHFFVLQETKLETSQLLAIPASGLNLDVKSRKLGCLELKMWMALWVSRHPMRLYRFSCTKMA